VIPANAPARLVVLAPNWLGDAVMALPLIADLRRAWPDTHIAVAARRAVAPLFAFVPEVAETLALDGSGGIGAVRSWRGDAARLQAGRFDAALLLPNSFLSAWLVVRARIPERWGYGRDLRQRLLTRVVPRPPGDAHQAVYYQGLASGLGLAVGPTLASLRVPDQAASQARELAERAGLPPHQRFVVFAPGAAYGRAKQWLPERFAELSRLLAAQDVATVLVGATGDMPACRDIARRTPAIDLAGQTDLATLIGLFTCSEQVVANDSGAMHLAAAVGARVVAIFGPTNDRQTSPLRATATAPMPAIVSTDVWCRPCLLRECPIDHRCMTQITASEVVNRMTGAPSTPGLASPLSRTVRPQ